MSIENLSGKVHSSMYHQCQTRGYAAPVDVLIDMGVLPKKSYENWRYGRVDYLERVCTVNLKVLSEIMKTVRAYAQKNELKPSFCYYKCWGIKRKTTRGISPLYRYASVKAEMRRSRKHTPRTMLTLCG